MNKFVKKIEKIDMKGAKETFLKTILKKTKEKCERLMSLFPCAEEDLEECEVCKEVDCLESK